jgi:hypothetical protein
MHESFDDALKDLEAALDVRPSAAFGAAVRERVATVAATNPRSRFRMFATAGALASLAIASAVLFAPRPEPRPAPAIALNPAVALRTTRIPSTPPPAEQEKVNRRRDVTLRRSSETLVDAGGVLVPSDQLVALTGFLGRHRMDHANVPGALIGAEGPLPELKPVEIRPIAIQPLPDLTGDIDNRRRP